MRAETGGVTITPWPTDRIGLQSAAKSAVKAFANIC